MNTFIKYEMLPAYFVVMGSWQKFLVEAQLSLVRLRMCCATVLRFIFSVPSKLDTLTVSIFGVPMPFWWNMFAPVVERKNWLSPVMM